MTVSSLFGSTAEPNQSPSDPDLVSARPTETHQGQTHSLYRKYRPQTFEADELVGQGHIVQTLRNAIHLDRVAHAYLFCGPRGTGKTTTARLLAKAINCLDPDINRRPCNACENCLAIASGATTDVIEIDAASNRGIDDIRDLRERVKYAPSQLKTKFYIIDEAHQITGAAANAFLKTLEEPPGHTKFVLATTDPEELLQTIVSRCQRFDFRRISLDQMLIRLERVAGLEGITVEREALVEIARNGTGSLRDAIGLLDQLAVYQEDSSDGTPLTVTLESVRALLGVSRNDRVEALALAIADRHAGRALAIVNDGVDAGDDPRQLNRQLVTYLRTLMYARAGSLQHADDATTQIAQRFNLGELAELANLFSQVDYRIKHSTYAQLPLEIALVEAATRGERATAQAMPTDAGTAPVPREVQSDPGYSAVGVTPQEIAAKPATSRLTDRVRGRATQPAEPKTTIAPPVSAPARTVASQVSTPPAPSAVEQQRVSPPEHDRPSVAAATGNSAATVGQLADLWNQIRLDVKAIDRRIEALLAATDPYDVRGSEVLLTTPYPFHCQRLNSDKEKGIVSDVIGRLLNQQVTIVCYLRGEEPPRSSGRQTPSISPSPPSEAARPEPTSTASAKQTSTPVALERLPESRPEEPASVVRAVQSNDTDVSDELIRAAMNIFDADPVDDLP